MNSIGLAVEGRYDNSLGMISRLTVLILTLWNVMFLTAADLRTGFEQAPIGEIREIKTAVGTWTAAAGHAEVTAGYHYMGKQCLHLFGGKARTIEFKPAESVKMPGHLVFQAERWTSRNPFQFRIEERVNGKWGELFNGDHAVVVGRAFKSRVTIPLTRNPERLRFVCTSPERSGLLIDDFALLPATPQKITGVTATKVQVPVLRGLKKNPLIHVEVAVSGSLRPIALIGASALAGGTGLASVQWLDSGSSANFDDAKLKPIGRTTRGRSETYALQSNHPLREGANHFWLSVELTDEADIGASLRAACTSLQFSNGSKYDLNQTEASVHRLGVAVRQGGQDGVHTSRIPGLAITRKGTLIGVYDLRHRSGGDLPGDIDVGLSRSTDGGRTWEPTRTIMDMGADPKWRYDGIGDPAVLVDRNTGTIWVAATWSHGNRSWVGSGPGMKPEETGQFMLVRSDDDGKTWSKPINITSQVKKPEWCFILAGPGKGITMADGTLVFAAQYQDPPGQRRLPHSTIIYSKDNGKTWRVGTGAYDDTTEAQVVEIEPGVLMLNCRYNRQSARVVMVTRDLGKTWKPHATHRKALIEPRACMASLISINSELTGKPGTRLLFSNPNSFVARQRMTLKVSPDRGNTWPEQSQLLLDQWRSAGYSCLSMIDDETVGILYEGSRAHMTFQRVKLADIGPDTRQASTGGAESPNALIGHLRGGLFGPAAIGGGTGGTGVKNFSDAYVQPGQGIGGTFLSETSHGDEPLRLENFYDAPQVGVAGGHQRSSLGGGQLIWGSIAAGVFHEGQRAVVDDKVICEKSFRGADALAKQAPQSAAAHLTTRAGDSVNWDAWDARAWAFQWGHQCRSSRAQRPLRQRARRFAPCQRGQGSCREKRFSFEGRRPVAGIAHARATRN